MQSGDYSSRGRPRRLSGKPPEIHIPSLGMDRLCEVQLRTQSFFITGVNGCDQSKAGTGVCVGGGGLCQTAKSKDGEKVEGVDIKVGQKKHRGE